ncbi:MAG: hypothetical protein M1831_002344 [Alyxoria varia]|nr:MAG: hypothetical protein M1831_002344 [Alyxoria varia]
MAVTSTDHPDANLFPHATGAAKSTVDAHQSSADVTLYAGWFCPFVQRAWIVLEEKQIPYQYVEVNPYHKPESLLQLNPRGLVPTLEYQNKPLYESTVLCEFLDEAFPDKESRLLPQDVFERARMRIWVDFVTSRIIPSFHRFLQHQPENGISPEQDAGLMEKREEFLSKLKEFIKEMDTAGPYFSGSELRLVDIAIAPWALRLWVFDHFKGGTGIPSPSQDGGRDGAIWNRWHKWVDAVGQRSSVKNTTSEREHYLPIYQRYAEDRAQSELAKSMRKGGGGGVP